MKTQLRLISLFLAMGLTAMPALNAQDAAAPAANKSEQKPKRERDPGAMWERAAKELSLSADQEAKWKDIGQQEKTALEALKNDASVAKEDKRGKMREINKTFGDQRRAVLTADQTTKFDEMRAKMRERGPRPPKGEKPDDAK